MNSTLGLQQDGARFQASRNLFVQHDTPQDIVVTAIVCEATETQITIVLVHPTPRPVAQLSAAGHQLAC